MPRFHAGYSMGTVAGALVGAAMVALDVSVTAHLLVVGRRGRGGGARRGAGVRPRHRRPDSDVRPAASAGTPAGCRAWREPRTLLIGLFVLAFAFAEGAGNDWISVALIDGYGTPPASGTLGFAVFLTAMTAGRWFGPALLDRYGRVPVVRAARPASPSPACCCSSSARAPPVAFAGVLLWGAGASLGFPVGMSAAADDPAPGGRAGQRDRVDRLLRLPRWATADRLPRRPPHGAARR